MLKRFLIIFIPIAILLVSLVCYNKFKTPYHSDIKLSDDLIIMSIREETLTNSDVNVTIVNKTSEVYKYGDEYILEEKKEDKWYELKKIFNDNVSTLMLYSLKEFGETQITINWGVLYGELKPGNYRIIKSFYKENEEKNKIYVSAEFTIK